MVFDMGVHHSARLLYLNKPLSFCTCACLTSLAFVLWLAAKSTFQLHPGHFSVSIPTSHTFSYLQINNPNTAIQSKGVLAAPTTEPQ